MKKYDGRTDYSEAVYCRYRFGMRMRMRMHSIRQEAVYERFPM